MYGPQTGNGTVEWWAYATWDWTYDQSHSQYSGASDWSEFGGGFEIQGFQESYSFPISSETLTDAEWIGFEIVGGDYQGDWTEWYLTSLTGGEFWIDFNLDGTPRVSSIAPSDFGKWSWNGLLNPNYIEPIAPLSKKHGKGHSK